MKPNYSPPPPPPSMSSSLNCEESATRNWIELPRDITATILQKVGPIDILNNAQRVCTPWRSISKDPLLWRVIDMADSLFGYSFPWSMDLDMMIRHAIDCSQGNLVAITLSHCVSDGLLHYIANSASHLQRLRLVCCYDISDEGLSEAVKKLPCLEELELTIGNLSEKSLKAIGRCCSLLKSLKFNLQSYNFSHGDGYAFAIAETMPNLRHLQLFRNELTKEGLLAILDGCPHLESLDLRLCYSVNLEGSLGRRCVEQIKVFLEPCDPSYDYPFEFLFDEDWLLSPTRDPFAMLMLMMMNII